MEEWRTIPGFENYEVSKKGRVRRPFTRTGKPKNKIIKQFPNKKGYMKVTIRKNKKPHTKKVHRLVAKAFIPNPENKPQVNHKDGDPANNHVSNLVWATGDENMRHSYRENGREPVKGSDVPTSKLDEKQVIEIKKFIKKSDRTDVDIAKDYPVSRFTIGRIRRGESWDHIEI